MNLGLENMKKEEILEFLQNHPEVRAKKEKKKKKVLKEKLPQPPRAMKSKEYKAIKKIDEYLDEEGGYF